MTLFWRFPIGVALLGLGCAAAQTLLLDSVLSKGDYFYVTGLDEDKQPLWEDGIGSGGLGWIGAGQLYGGFVQTNIIGSIVKQGQLTLSDVSEDVFDATRTERFSFHGAATMIGSSDIAYLSGYFQQGWYEINWTFREINYQTTGNYQIDGQAPIITQQPESVTVEAGAPFQLSASASSGQVEWFKDGEAIGAAAPASDSATTLDAGVYQALFTEGSAQVWSELATVTITAPSTKLTMEVKADGITLRWQSCLDHHYDILHSTNLVDWEPTGLSYIGDGEMITIELPTASSNQFYVLAIDYP